MISKNKWGMRIIQPSEYAKFHVVNEKFTRNIWRSKFLEAKFQKITHPSFNYIFPVHILFLDNLLPWIPYFEYSRIDNIECRWMKISPHKLKCISWHAIFYREITNTIGKINIVLYYAFRRARYCTVNNWIPCPSNYKT